VNNKETGKVKHVIKTTILPDDKRLISYPIYSALIIAIAGLLLENKIIIFVSLIIPLLMGFAISIHLLYFLFTKIEIYDDKLIIVNRIGHKIVKSNSRQEIYFDDIDYVYFLEKELNILLALRDKLKDYKISEKEKNYTTENLIEKYKIPREIVEVEKFSNIEPDIENIEPFLHTTINFKEYRYITNINNPGASGFVKKMKSALVLSSADGLKKIYLMHTDELAKKDFINFLKILNLKTKNLKYLMSEDLFNF